MSIVELSTAYLPDLMALQHACYVPSMWDTEEVVARMLGGEVRHGVMHDGQIVASIVGHRVASDIFIYSVEVHPTARRQGYGRTLVTVAAEIARGLGLTGLTAHALPDGRSLLRSLGFREGPMIDVCGHPAVSMRLDLQ